MRKKQKKNKIIKIIADLSFLGAVLVLTITLYNNITLNNRNRTLQDSLEEYKTLREEIDGLNNLKENYDIAKLNTENLTTQKEDLETKINELNTKINNLNQKIDKLK